MINIFFLKLSYTVYEKKLYFPVDYKVRVAQKTVFKKEIRNVMSFSAISLKMIILYKS